MLASSFFGLTQEGDRWRWINRPLGIDQSFIFGQSTTLPQPPMEYVTRQCQGDFCLIDQRNGRRTIYLPQFQGESRLNAAARATWQSLGYRVVPIDVTSAFRYFGTLHCLVNVLDKGPA